MPGGPAAVAQRHEDLAGLVDGERRVEGGRPEGLVERSRRGQADGVAVHRGAAVAGDGARPVLGHDGLQPLGDLVEGAAGRDLVEAAFRAPLEGGAEAVGVVVLVAEVAALHAGVAAEDRVGLVAAHAHHPVVVDVHLDGARGVAEATERPLGLDRHGEPPELLIRRHGHRHRRQSPPAAPNRLALGTRVRSRRSPRRGRAPRRRPAARAGRRRQREDARAGGPRRSPARPRRRTRAHLPADLQPAGLGRDALASRPPGRAGVGRHVPCRRQPLPPPPRVARRPRSVVHRARRR